MIKPSRKYIALVWGDLKEDKGTDGYIVASKNRPDDVFDANSGKMAISLHGFREVGLCDLD